VEHQLGSTYLLQLSLSTINQLILIVNFFQLIFPALAQPINLLGRSERQNQLQFNLLGVCIGATLWRIMYGDGTIVP
jgi:hypothetical protein